MGATRVLVAIGLFVALLSIHEEGQAIYRCYDKEGRQVLTDQPAQLEQCTSLGVTSPSKSSSSLLPVAPTPAMPGPTEGRNVSPEDQNTNQGNRTVNVPLQ